MSKLDSVHPELRKRAEKIIQLVKEAGYSIIPASTYRSFREQRNLYSIGRTRKGNKVTNAPAGFSPHNYGCAVDFCLETPVIYKGIFTQYPDVHPVWDLIGKFAKQVGVEWGGSWKKFKDRPHIEVPLLKWGKPTLALMGGVEDDFGKVWAEANKVFANQSSEFINTDSNETWIYVVKSGDTLSTIAEKFLGDARRYPEILRENTDIKGNTILIGQELEIPKR